MKLNLSITYNYLLVLGITLLFTPSSDPEKCVKKNVVKTKKKTIASTVVREGTELLHGEMLFRY